jgi:hypothetical protein
MSRSPHSDIDDPNADAKAKDVVGRFVNPPAHAVASTRQQKPNRALDRTQPGLSMKESMKERRCATLGRVHRRDGPPSPSPHLRGGHRALYALHRLS